LSRPKFYWHGIVRKMIMRYPELKSEDTKQAKAYTTAIEDALAYTLGLDNGNDKIEAISLVLIKKTHTVDGAALELNYSPRTVQRWVIAFVKTVGKNVGF